MKQKVLIVGHFPPAAGGITSLLLTIFNSQLTEQYELLPFNIGRPAKPNVTNNAGYRVLWNAGFKRALIALWLTLWHMGSFPFVVLWQKPAMIHIHTAPFLVFWETAYYVLVSCLLQYRCALQFHFSFRYFYEVSGPRSRAAMLWVTRQAQVFVVICQEDVDFIARITQNGPRCVYLPNFIDVKAFRRSIEQVKEPKRNPSEVAILFLGGSEARRKGLGDLLQGIRLLTPTYPNLRFLLVAVPQELVEQELPPECLAQCEVYSWAAGAAKARMFARADIFILPSYGEGMPIGILEAMACSLSVISTRVGGIPDMITEGEEGHLINTGDEKGLAQVISELAHNADMREQMGRKGFEKVQRLYNVPVGVQSLQSLYEEMIPGSRSALRYTAKAEDEESQQRNAVAP